MPLTIIAIKPMVADWRQTPETVPDPFTMRDVDCLAGGSIQPRRLAHKGSWDL